jgi:GcrA cell cycle regulator
VFIAAGCAGSANADRFSIGHAPASCSRLSKEALMSWTEERVELLRKLWSDGLSAAQVAAELGSGITRNAVIGKIHRLGLAERAKTSSAPRPRAPRAPRTQTEEVCAQGAAVMGNVALALSPNTFVALAPRPDEENVVPISARVTLMELRESMCRWPLGDPSATEFRFCGAKSPAGSGPYCCHHASIAYQPAQDRRRREPVRAMR